ncbi:hypothetical protein M758_UG313600 [Ceratodon purpureus]|nr:hypothetical protein M758_UG313600 [Ceratodon purpureus]
MASTPSKRFSMSLSPAQQAIAQSDYMSMQERLLSPMLVGRHALDLSIEEVDALVRGNSGSTPLQPRGLTLNMPSQEVNPLLATSSRPPPLPPRSRRYLLQGDLRVRQQANI